MKVNMLNIYNDTEKISLLGHLNSNVSEEVKTELDIRLKNLEEETNKLYSLDEVKAHLKTLR